jgi:hypothetical protein
MGSEYNNQMAWKRAKNERRKKLLVHLVWFVLCSAVLVAHSCSSKEKLEKPKVELKADLMISHKPNAMCPSMRDRYDKLVSYFKRNKNPHPEMSATAVLETKRPKLMAAVAVKGEKNTPYTNKKGGYKKRHYGMYQVSKKDWGYAGALPIDQALKSEKVLEEFEASYGGSVYKGLNAYGGDVTKNMYAKNILNELQNIP